MFTSTTGNGRLAAMKRPTGLLLMLVATNIVATGCIQVQSGNDGFSMMSGTIHVEEDEVAREEIVAIGSSVIIDGRARRDVVVIGGRLTVNGEVEGTVSVVGGTLVLGPGARIEGDAVVVGGSLRRHDSARIGGESINVTFYGFDGVFGGRDWSPSFGGFWGFTPFAWIARTTQLFYWLLLALLTVALVGDRVSSASHAISREPLRLGAIGLVGVIALCFAFLVLVILSFVIIGIPFLIGLIFMWWLAYIFGVVAVFQSIGNRVMNLAGRSEASQIAIVLAGGLALGILRYLPFGFGALLWFVASLVGIGAVFATRFGTGRRWVQTDMAPAGAPATPAEPAEAAAPVEPTAPVGSGGR